MWEIPPTSLSLVFFRVLSPVIVFLFSVVDGFQSVEL